MHFDNRPIVNIDELVAVLVSHSIKGGWIETGRSGTCPHIVVKHPRMFQQSGWWLSNPSEKY